MADSMKWVAVPTSWVNIYTMLNIPAGTGVEVANVSTVNIRLVISSAAPTSDQMGRLLSNFGTYGSVARVSAGESGLWAKAVTNSGNLSIERL